MNRENRLSKWEKEEKKPLFFDYPLNPEFDKYLKDTNFSNEAKLDSTFDLMKLAQELVFDIVEDLPVIYFIDPMLDTRKFEIAYCPLLKTIFEGGEDEIENDIINTLGLAVAFEVPVYPNSPKVENKLSHYYKKLVQNGFTAPDEKGNDVRLRPTHSKNISDFGLNKISKIDLTKLWSPTDLLLLRSNIKDEFLKLNNAHRTLTH